MTDRVYYRDPSVRDFDASVVAVERHDRHPAVRLDRTAFYPTSGGQPFDTGTLGSLRVVEVLESTDGDVVHILEGVSEGDLPRVGQQVRGTIDWARRFDHMQQHTGQHLLSAAFDRLFSVRTVSFHLGAQVCTIDLARGVSPEEIAAAEDLANQVVWEDRAVTVRFASAEEAAQLPLRKESGRAGTLRLIDVDRFDLSACGGTHVARTGSVGVIAVSGDERVKGGQRVEFLCGGRALARFRVLRQVVAAGVGLLSVQPAELAGAIERLQSEARAQKKALAGLQSELAAHRAAALVASAEPFDRGRLILREVDADAGGLKALASAAATAPGHLAVLASAQRPALVVVARSADVDVEAPRILAALIARFGGRGGGKPDLAQGGGLDAPAAAIFEEVRRLVSAPPSGAP